MFITVNSDQSWTNIVRYSHDKLTIIKRIRIQIALCSRVFVGHITHVMGPPSIYDNFFVPNLQPMRPVPGVVKSIISSLSSVRHFYYNSEFIIRVRRDMCACARSVVDMNMKIRMIFFVT